MAASYQVPNSSANLSQDWNATDPEEIQPRKVLTMVQITCYCIILVIGTIGNFMLILSLLLKRHRKTSEYFILNLATVDLLSCSLSVPFDIILIAIGGWPFGSFMCKIVYPLQTVFMSVSVATLLCMALERHRAILHPLRPRIKGRVICGVIMTIWLISVVLVSPYALSLKSEDGNCVENWPNDNASYPKAFTLCVFLILYIGPLCVISVAYTAVGKRLRVDSRKVRLLLGESRQDGKNIAKIRANRNIHVVKIFVFAVVAFALCLMPFQVMWMWSDFGQGQTWKHFDKALTFANVMVYANSAINPFIFGALGRRYRTCKCCYRNKLELPRVVKRFPLFRFEDKTGVVFGRRANTEKVTLAKRGTIRMGTKEYREVNENTERKHDFFTVVRETTV